MCGRILSPTTVLMTCFAMVGAYSQQQKPQADTASARLTAAKNVLVTRVRGNNIPYEVIKSTLDGWGRFTIVEKPEQAELVVQVSTSGGDNAVSVSSSSRFSPGSGSYEQSNRTS